MISYQEERPKHRATFYCLTDVEVRKHRDQRGLDNAMPSPATDTSYKALEVGQGGIEASKTALTVLFKKTCKTGRWSKACFQVRSRQLGLWTYPGEGPLCCLCVAVQVQGLDWRAGQPFGLGSCVEVVDTACWLQSQLSLEHRFVAGVSRQEQEDQGWADMEGMCDCESPVEGNSRHKGGMRQGRLSWHRDLSQYWGSCVAGNQRMQAGQLAPV